MPASDGWYLLGPLLAVALSVLLGMAFCRLGRDDDARHDPYVDGLAIFGEREDYGLLRPAAVTGDADVAAEIRRLLGVAGIRATYGTGRDGRIAVLVFAEQLEEARRLVGDSPAL
jgi:hypothetical protein